MTLIIHEIHEHVFLIHTSDRDTIMVYIARANKLHVHKFHRHRPWDYNATSLTKVVILYRLGHFRMVVFFKQVLYHMSWVLTYFGWLTIHLYIFNFHYIAYTALPYYIHKYTFTHFVDTSFVEGYRAFSTIAPLTHTYSITLLISTMSTKSLHENMY